MLTKRIIPCLDTRNGQVVKGIKFASLRELGDPAELASVYQSQGADEIVLLDVSATPEGRNTALSTIRSVRSKLSIPLSVGGGVRCVADARNLLEAGADKVGVNTAAVLEPRLLEVLANTFGRQCTVLAIDAASRVGTQHDSCTSHSWEVVIKSGTERTGKDAIRWAQEAESLGAGEILLTSWDRDGTRSGYDLDLIAEISKSVSIPIIASGGANEPLHLYEALVHGADAVLAASIFHDGDFTVRDIKTYLHNRGVSMRL